MKTQEMLAGVVMMLVSTMAAAKGGPSTNAYAYIDLGTLGGIGSIAEAVNTPGHAAGRSWTGALDAQGQAINHAFFWYDANGNHQSDPGEMIDLGVLDGATNSDARAVNDGDVVVGSCYGGIPQTAFIWDSANGMRDLNSLVDAVNPANAGWHLDYAESINNLGQVLCQGTCTDPATGTPRRNGVLLDLTSGTISELAGDATAARALNNAGQVAGGPRPAYLWQDGAQYDIGVPTGAAESISDSGLVAGELQLSRGGHVFLWTPSSPNGTTGSYIDCGALRTPKNAPPLNDAYGVRVVNGTATIVGDSRTGTFDKSGFLIFHAFRWQPDTGMQDLNSLVDMPSGLYLREADALSTGGIIVGQTSGSYAHAFELLPQ